MKKYLLCTLAFLAANHSLAEPESGFYSGAALSRWQYDQPVPAARADVQTLELNAGFWFHPLLSAEIRGGMGLGDSDLDIGGVPWELTLDNFGSIYWRPEVRNRAAKLYALLGYSDVTVSAETITGAGSLLSTELSESGMSFGLGVGLTYNDQVTLNLEWKQLLDADGFEITGYTAGFDYRF